MKRDFDLIRQILLAVEAEHTGRDDVEWDLSDLSKFGGCDRDEFFGNFKLLIKAGFLEPDRGGDFCIDDKIYTYGLTWYGHEFLDSIRDEKVWRKTKEGARKVGSFSVDVLTDIARAIINKKIKDLTGGEFGLEGEEA